MSLAKEFKIFYLSIIMLCSISSNVFAVDNSEANKIPAPINNSIEESTNNDYAQQQRISDLENRVNALDARISNIQSQVNDDNNRASYGLVSFLFGAFCALWAQNTRRNALGWFIGGALLNVIAVLILLWHNRNDQSQPPFRVS